MGWQIVLAALKSLIAWFVLTFVGTNLIDMVIGGLAHPIHSSTPDVPFLQREAAKARTVNYVSAVLFSVLAGVYLWALWRYLNPGSALAAAMLILSRVPESFRQMRTGEKTANGHNSGIDYVATALWLLALPVLFVSFYV